jgi:hypothetical protein
MTVPPSVKEIDTLTVSATSELIATDEDSATEAESTVSAGAHPNNTKLNDKANNNFFIFPLLICIRQGLHRQRPESCKKSLYAIA